MRYSFLLSSLLLVLGSCSPKKKPIPNCQCDTLNLRSNPGLSTRDTAITTEQFFELDDTINRRLWYHDIESTDSTRFTRLWDDYHEHNFHASHTDFKTNYKGSSRVELAFQFGPSGPLWSFYTFVLRKEQCCYVLTRSSFVHARFRYKAYTFPTEQQIDSLFGFIEALPHAQSNEENEAHMRATFVDNRNDDAFDVLLEQYKYDKDGRQQSVPVDSAVIKLLDYVDRKMRWTESYPLDPPEIVKAQKFYDNALLSGTYQLKDEKGSFTGELKISRNPGNMHYEWSLISDKQKLLAAKSSKVNFDQIPEKEDKFEFVKTKALTEIKEYRIGGSQAITDLTAK